MVLKRGRRIHATKSQKVSRTSANENGSITMPTYDYLCKSCGQTFETRHGFNDLPSPCQECKGTELQQVFDTPPLVFIKGEITTLGQLAEKNTTGMGRSELEDKRSQQAKGNLKQKRWQDKAGDATPKEIQKMTSQQKNKYIREGKK